MKMRAALSLAHSLAQTGTQTSASVNTETDSHLEFKAQLGATHFLLLTAHPASYLHLFKIHKPLLSVVAAVYFCD